MFSMAFLANKPFCLAPGMGLNSFFAVVVANVVSLTGLSYLESFQAALCIIFIEGIIFIILSVLNIRDKIVDAIPLGVRLGIAPAIGLMLLNIGLGSNVGVYDDQGNCFYVMRDFFGSLTAGLVHDNMGTAYPEMVLTVITMFVGLFVIVFWHTRTSKVRSSSACWLHVSSTGWVRVLSWATTLCFPRNRFFCPGFRRHGFDHPV